MCLRTTGILDGVTVTTPAASAARWPLIARRRHRQGARPGRGWGWATRRGLALVALVALIGACRSPAPAPAGREPPRLVAESACEGAIAIPAEGVAALPVPPRGAIDPYALPTAAWLGFVDGGGFHRATHVCDLPDRILVVAAEQGVRGGKRQVGGTVWTLPRTDAAPRVPPQAINPASPGCRQGAPTCTWRTSSPALTSLDTIPDQRVSTSGWVHGADDLCRALPDDTIATCSTARRLAYVEVGCPTSTDRPVALELGLHDATLDRRFEQDVEVPVGRLVGAAEVANGTTYRYRFAAPDDAGAAGPAGRASGPRTAVLAFDLAAARATLTLDGIDEPCLAFGLHRR